MPGFFYIIAAPKYTRLSAGVRVLHNLCDHLNQHGQRAYIALYPHFIFEDRSAATSPALNTPLITQALLQEFIAQGMTPIVLYPEVVRGNPFNAPIVVRYVMNYPGLLGGDASYPDSDIIYSYSKRLSRSLGIGEDRTMFMPVSDDAFFVPPPPGTVRSGSCYYAAKYKYHFNGQLSPLTADSTEITRDFPNSQTREQIRDLLQRSELYFGYEDTALTIEAALCGCPAVLIQNEFFREALGLEDLGMDGIAWGTSPGEIQRAKDSVHKFRDNYDAVKKRYWQQFAHFVEETQAIARARGKVPNTLTLPDASRLGGQTIFFVANYLRHYGLRHFLFKARHYMRKRGFRNTVGNAFKNFAGGGASDRRP